MTVSSTTRKAGPFAGNNAATSFPFTFKVFDKTNIQVLRVSPNGVATTLTLDSDYSVTLNADQNATPGGSFTYPVSGPPLPAGYQLVGLGNLPDDQPIDITNQGGFYPNVIEKMVDRATIQIQQLSELAGRAIVLNESETVSPVLPTPAARANTLMGFDALGNVTTLPITASVGAGDLKNESWTAGTDYTAGTSTSVTLSRAYGTKANLGTVMMAGVGQDPNTYSLNGTTLTFLDGNGNPTPIPAYVSRVWCVGGTTLSTQIPPDQSITDAKLAPGSRVYNRSFFSVDLMEYGADRFGVVASDAALAAALMEAANRGGAKITAPRGKFKFTSKKTYTHPAATACLGIEGAGPGLTEFSWSSADAIQVNHVSAFNSTHLRGLTFSTAAVGGGTGVNLNQTAASIPDPGNSALNVFESVVFQGADGQKQAQYFGNAISIFGVSNINFNDVQICGKLAFYATTGSGVLLAGSSALPSVVYNFKGCTFNLVNVGLNYGNWVQGVSLSQCNLTGNAIGVNVPAGITGTDQLYIAGSQFNCITAFNVLSSCQATSMTGCLVIIPQGGAGVNMDYVSLTSIVGNTFAPSSYSNTVGNGILIGQTVLHGAVITGNSFYGIPNTAVFLQANSSANNVQSNSYAACGTSVVNLGTGNIVGGGSA